jgi:hypothetical protein
MTLERSFGSGGIQRTIKVRWTSPSSDLSTACVGRPTCRHCYGLAYESQQEPRHQRGLGKAQKIRMQLGGSQNMFEPFPDKPKGMHWRTYDRRRGAYDVAHARFMKGCLQRQAPRRSRR